LKAAAYVGATPHRETVQLKLRLKLLHIKLLCNRALRLRRATIVGPLKVWGSNEMAIMGAKDRTSIFGFALTLIIATGHLAWATDRTIILRLGSEAPLLLEKPFKTVMIGDPHVVDVVTRGDRSIIIQPHAVGATNIIFLDGRSIVTANIGILVCKAVSDRIAYQDEPVCERVDATKRPPT
jgi:Flp pilus assembly secretin CpaC